MTAISCFYKRSFTLSTLGMYCVARNNIHDVQILSEKFGFELPDGYRKAK
jgi:hypothetical protein